MTNEIERRVAVDALEVRQEGEDEPRRLVGYAAVFDSPAEIMPGFIEEVAPGAFSRAISEGQDVRALINHDASLLLGRTSSGTLRLSEDDRGLRVEIDPPDTQAARDLAVMIERGDLNQMSFGFRVVDEEIEMDENRNLHRRLTDVDLADVSPVTFPAYADTAIAQRKAQIAQQCRQSTLVRARMKLREMQSFRETVAGSRSV